MKILHVVRQFAPSIGGLEGYVKSMALHQQARGHECAILTLNREHAKGKTETALPEHEILEGLPIRRVGFFGRRRFFLPFVPLGYVRQFDIIHVHNTDGFFDLLALMSPLVGRPLIATSHGGFFHTKAYSWIKSIYFPTITRFSCLAYDIMFTNSENDHRTFSQLMSRLILQPNAVEPLGDFTASGSDFIYIGRLAEHKNLPELIQTFALYKKQHHGVGNLHIVGPDWDLKKTDLESLARHLDVSEYIQVHGFVASGALEQILRNCGFIVSASLFEGFGMSMIEGMSIGLIPLVQPNLSFQVLLEQGQVGSSVDYTQPEKAASRLTELVHEVSPELRARARKFAAKFSWDTLTDTSLKVYEEKLKLRQSA